MVTDPAERTAGVLRAHLAALDAVPPRVAADAVGRDMHAARRQRLLDVYRAMLLSRELDLAARRLKADGRGYYTIASAGHEYNAVLGEVLRATDPCFLHYRSGALMAARRRDDEAFVRDTIASLMASPDDPVASGRHKVWGSPDGWTPPQTSTIASHLPKAVGTAIAIDRVRQYGTVVTPELAEIGADGIVCVSFGDGSMNHASAQAAFTMARWSRRAGAGVPILFVCEDNGLGLSVTTPSGWVEATLKGLPLVTYVRAEGNFDQRLSIAQDAVDKVRRDRGAVVLHLPTVRLWGHAGSDVEHAYRTPAQIRASEAADPLVEAATWLVESAVTSAADLICMRDEIVTLVDQTIQNVTPVRHEQDRDIVVGQLAMQVDDEAARAAQRRLSPEQLLARAEAHSGGTPEHATLPQHRTMASHLTSALDEALTEDPRVMVFGEDVGRKGGVYGVTSGLQARHGVGHVFDTMLDETSILGAAQGFGLVGRVPVPEIQYLAYIHNALDQIRGEAASTSWFSDGQFATPMVVRIASFAYQRGFGGHFHNDNAIGALRDIPGLFIAAPSRGDDAVRMLRTALALAGVQRRVVAFLEPIALYHERDLHETGDNGWLTTFPAVGPGLLPGEAGVYPAGHVEVASHQVTSRGSEQVELPGAPPVHPAGTSRQSATIDDYADIVIASYANGLRMALRTARRLLEDGVRARVLDLRWLNPLPFDAIAVHAAAVGRLLVVDECRATGGGIADAVLAEMVRRRVTATMDSVTAADSYVPLGPAADTVLVTEQQIEDAALGLVRRGPR